MAPGIDKDGFDRQIETTYKKLEGLLQRMSTSGEEASIASQALEELSTTLEELHVASDELSRQNMDLAAAHLALQAERQRYQDLFDFAPDGYLVTDTNGVIREANRAAAELLHVAQERLNGKPLAVYVAEGERKAFRDILSTLLKRSITGANEWEISLRPRGGKELKASITVTPVVPLSAVVPAVGLEGVEGVGLRWSLRDITESKRAEERERLLKEARQAALEARQANRLLQTLLDTMPVGVTVCDPDGTIKMVNTPGQKILGGTVRGTARSPERNFELLYPDGSPVPADQTPMVRGLEAKEITDNLEFVIRKADGSELTLLASAAPVLDTKGQVLGGVTVFRDITRDKQVDEQVKSLAKFPSENPNPVLRVSGKGVLLYANPASQGLLDEWQTAVDQPLPEFWQTILAEAGNEKKLVEVKSSEKVFSFLVGPMPGTGYINLYGRDVTESRLAQNGLQESEERYRALVENSPDLILRFDREMRMVFANPATLLRTGRPADTLLGLTPREYGAAQASTSAWEPIFRQVMQTGKTQRFDNTSIWQGQARTYDALAVPEFASDGTVATVMVIARDITEKRQAEQELRKHEADLRAILDATRESIWMFDPDSTILMANATALVRLQRTSEEVIGQPFSTLLPQELANSRMASLQKVVESGVPLEVEDELAGINFQHTYYPVKDSRGQVVRVVAFSQDITQRRRAEELLQTTLQRFYNFLSSMYTGLLLLTDEGRVEFANQAFCDLFSLKDSPHSLSGAPGNVILTKIKSAYQYPEQALQRVREIVELNLPVRSEEVAMRNGRQLLRDFIPIQVDGKSSGRLWYHTDITELKRAEEALKESEERYRKLVQYAPAAIYEMDLPGSQFISVNDVMCAILKYSREELLSIKPTELMDADSQALFKERVRKKLAGQEIEESVAYRIRRKDGVWIYTDINVGAITFVDDKPSRVVVIGHDITERKQAEEALNRQARLLDLSYEAIFAWELDGPILSWNKGAEQLYGFSSQEAVGRVSHQLLRTVHPEKIDTIRSILSRDRTWSGELEHITRDGKHIIVESRHQLLEDQTGRQIVLETNRNITERKQAEEERARLLAEVEKRAAELEATFSSMATGLIVYDQAGKAIRMNDIAKKLLPEQLFFNLTVEERARVLRWETETGQPVPASEIPVARALHGETSHDVILLARFPDHKLWIAASAAPILTADGKRLGVVASFVDITRSKEAEQALQESETRLRRLYESGLLGVIYWNMKGEIVDANDKFLEMTGYTPQELSSGKIDWASMTPAEFRHLDEASMLELKTTGINAKPFEKEYIRKDGTRFPIMVAGAMLDEICSNGVAFVLDITERKQAELETQKLLKEVQEEKDRLATLVNNISDEIWFADANKQFTLANPAALREFGVDPGNVLDIEKFAASLKVYRPDGSSRPVDEAPPLRALQGETVRNQEEIIRIPSSGQLRHREVSASPVRGPDGSIIGAISVVRDITERKQVEQKLQATNDELRRFNKAMVGRELRMVELKSEVNEFCKQSGLPERYGMEDQTHKP